MSPERYQRKLTAILSADVVGYSRLMGENEAATVETLNAYKDIMTLLIQQHRGRVVDSPGDNLLAEFASVVDAVKSSMKIQDEIRSRNKDISDNRRMEFRIGINLGDVIDKGGQIYGDGVNIAARIERISEAGGIAISGTVYEHIKNKLSLGYHYLGEQNVKNISEPVRVYQILTDPEAIGTVIDEKRSRPRPRYRMVAALAVLVIGIVATAIWMYTRPSFLHEETESKEKMTLATLDKPSIAVLPFTNLSDDPDQEYFSDGITNDIITDLSKFKELFVIASNSVFIYKGKPVKVQKVNRELGARYILEGSVQRASKKVRVNAQLIDATTGHHLWAERYDQDLKDLFAIQDELVETIVTTLAVKIDAEERARVMRKDTESLDAYDYVLRGWEYFSRTTRSANIQARQMFAKAIELDPHYATAYVGLGQTNMSLLGYGWTEFSNQALRRAHDLAKKALSLDETSAPAHALLGEVYRFQMQYDLAIKEYERAIELNPNDANSHAERGAIMNFSGQTDSAIRSLETSFRFNPHMRAKDYMQLGLAYYLKGRYEESLGTLERGLSWYPDYVFIHIRLAAAYAKAGRLQDATRVAATIRRLHPFFEVDSFGNAFIDPAHRASIADGLRKAGFQ
jgi:adenylate cyclase